MPSFHKTPRSEKRGDRYQDKLYMRKKTPILLLFLFLVFTPFGTLVSAEESIDVSPSTGLETSEAGGSDTFTVVLGSKPEADVTIPLASTDTGEGTVSPASLTFTPADWNSPQTVTVTGVDDSLDDGDVAYTITTGPSSCEYYPPYDGLDPDDVMVTNRDNDEPVIEQAGIDVSPDTVLETREAGGSDTFYVFLDSRPGADVTIPLASTDTGEGTVSPASLTFTPSDWDSPQTVTITGVDDSLDDGDVAYTITIGPSSSNDGNYDGLAPDDVWVSNRDDDQAGIGVSPDTVLETSEAGGSDIFTVVLDSRPGADVTIPLASTDTGEGTVSPASLTFTPSDWDSPQTVTITGVDDSLDDGDVAYTITIGPGSSNDENYNGLDPENIQGTNIDNNISLKIAEPAEGLTTSEEGGTDSFTAVLSSRPAEDFHFSLESSDPSEGTVSPASLTFTPSDWDSSRTVTVTGVDDDIDDGTVNYMITISANGAYPEYTGLQSRQISSSNEDNDTADIIVEPTSGLMTSQSGGSDTFTVVLGSQPTASVDIYLSSSDPGCGIVSPDLLTFTADNWNSPQTVTVTGQHNASDEDVAYTIISSSAVSSDGSYDGLDPADVKVTNTDNLPPDPPQYVSPDPFQLFTPGDTVTLRASAFADPEGDSHLDSHWLIGRADRDPLRCGDDPDSFDHLSEEDLTKYTIFAEDLVSGMAYKWIVGYRDTGSRAFAWSDNKDRNISAASIYRASNSAALDGDELAENVFIVGYQQSDEMPPIPWGLTEADYRMLCCQHYIPGDPSASAVIGDDLVSGYDTGHYRIGTYDPELNDGGYAEYPNFSLSPGRAVWFLARSGLTVDIEGVPVSITEDVEIPLNFNNKSNNGWNMIGPPNDRNYLWSDVEVVVYGDACNVVFGPERIGNLDDSNPYIDTRLWEWNDGTYADDTTMLTSGYGYWVRAKQKNVSLRFPVGAQAKLSNPSVMLAIALDKTRRLGQKIIFPETVSAGHDTDTPPAPMQALGVQERSESPSGGNCFISVIGHRK
mgnify:CR=1 FL=1